MIGRRLWSTLRRAVWRVLVNVAAALEEAPAEQPERPEDGPPAIWLERVRESAPELLDEKESVEVRPPARPIRRTMTTSRQQLRKVAVQRRIEPAAPPHKRVIKVESETQTRERTKKSCGTDTPVCAAQTRVSGPQTISPQPARPRVTTDHHEPERQRRSERTLEPVIVSAKKRSQTATLPAASSRRAVQQPQTIVVRETPRLLPVQADRDEARPRTEVTAPPSTTVLLQWPVLESAPRRPARREYAAPVAQPDLADRWPELPDFPPFLRDARDVSESNADEADRLRRLDDEQQGVVWTE